MRTVARFSLTPIKGTRLHHPEGIRIERYGAVGDRWFYFARPDGRFVAGAAFGPLVRIRADYDVDGEHLAMAFPDGTRVQGDASDLGEAVDTIMWGRPLQGRVVKGPFSDAMTRFVGSPIRVVRANEPGGALDQEPVTLFSTASAEEFAARADGERGADVRRWRLLIELDGCEPREEHAWEGRRLRIGDAVIEAGGAVPRCVVTTQDPNTGRRDLDTLDVLARYRGRPDGKHVEFGIYGRVVEPGTIRVGDRAELLP